MGTPQARRIITEPVEERYARGWHCLGMASDYTGQAQALNYFGTRLVAYRGGDGKLVILDGYCPHMGADMSLGKVEGNSLRCPFHAWRWGADGICNEIPYADAIPPAACVKSWPTLETNKLVFVWNDPEGRPPIAAQAIPYMAETDSDEWTDWAIAKMTIHTNSRELVDNMADFAHFAPVHGSPVKEFRNIVDGHTYTQELLGSSARLGGDSELFSQAVYYGPAYMTTTMKGELQGVEVNSRLLVTHVPIDTGSFDLRFGVMVKKNPALSDADNALMANEYVKLSQEAFFEDVHIWHTKTRVDNPLLCNGDGPINILRKWYQQFYTDVAEIPANAFENRVYSLKIRGWQHLM